MAVEKAKLITRLKALFPKANLSQKRLDAIADKLAKKPADDADDDAIDVVINDFNDILSIEGIAKDDDRARTLEADNKAKAELLAKNKIDDPKPADPKPADSPKGNDDAPAWAKTLLEKVDNLEKGKIADTKIQTATKLFGASDVLKGMKPELQEKWINRINTNSETTIEDQVKELETEYSEFRQSFADSTEHSGPTPFQSGGKNEPSADEINEIIEEQLN